ncbi:hypothetical protein SISSUDRAFT_1038754, partial [Sistotremastrum suecicum HHB10207 ss-3]
MSNPNAFGMDFESQLSTEPRIDDENEDLDDDEPTRPVGYDPQHEARIQSNLIKSIENAHNQGRLTDITAPQLHPARPGALPVLFEPTQEDLDHYRREHVSHLGYSDIGGGTAAERDAAIQSALNELRECRPATVRMSELGRRWKGYEDGDKVMNVESLNDLTKRQRIDLDMKVAYPPSHRHSELIEIRRTHVDIDAISIVSSINSGFDMLSPKRSQ